MAKSIASKYHKLSSCLHEIANPLLMEAAFANIIGADMNAVVINLNLMTYKKH